VASNKPPTQNSAHTSELGKATVYKSQYDPGLLFPIPRSTGREQLGIANEPPFKGADLWTAWEVSWLNSNGLPQVAVAEIVVPVTSACIIESKSLKLYLNSFNQTHFADWDSVAKRMTQDLTAATQCPVNLSLMSLAQAQHYFRATQLVGPPAIELDQLPIVIDDYHPNPELLVTDRERAAAGRVEETLVSHLLKSNCPVTGQPDWASLWIQYQGAPIDHKGLLKYIVSFRDHQDFHEQCVERCFTDIHQYCQPEQLTVYARYTRRGGLDINPFRSTNLVVPKGDRDLRQ
jgi:7-cyano-7-deazaguanine reductase